MVTLAGGVCVILSAYVCHLMIVQHIITREAVPWMEARGLTLLKVISANATVFAICWDCLHLPR